MPTQTHILEPMDFNCCKRSSEQRNQDSTNKQHTDSFYDVNHVSGDSKEGEKKKKTIIKCIYTCFALNNIKMRMKNHFDSHNLLESVCLCLCMCSARSSCAFISCIIITDRFTELVSWMKITSESTRFCQLLPYYYST